MLNNPESARPHAPRTRQRVALGGNQALCEDGGPGRQAMSLILTLLLLFFITLKPRVE